MLEPVLLCENGPVFSRIVFGVMKWGQWGHQLKAQQMLRLIEQSLEHGVTTFDHADIYGSYTTEVEFGSALALKPALREQLQIVTKCGIKMKSPNRPEYQVKSYDMSRKHILESVNRSLQNLQTDYIDLLLLHRPSPLMEPEEIAEAFGALSRKGKVKYFGVSNFTPSQYELMNRSFPLATNQVEASLLHLNPFFDSTFDQCQLQGVKPMAWSPLGGGHIFSKTPDAQAARILRVAEKIIGRRGAPFGIDQVLLAWLLRHPAGILPVVGTARIERVAAATRSDSLQLTREEWFELWEASRGQEVP